MSAISQMFEAKKKCIPERALESAIQKVYKAEHGNSVPLDASSREYQNTKNRILQFKHNQSGRNGAVSYLKNLMLNDDMARSDAWAETMEKYFWIFGLKCQPKSWGYQEMIESYSGLSVGSIWKEPHRSKISNSSLHSLSSSCMLYFLKANWNAGTFHQPTRITKTMNKRYIMMLYPQNKRCIAKLGGVESARLPCKWVISLLIRGLSAVYPWFIRCLSAVYPFFIRCLSAVHPPFFRCLTVI